MPELYRSLVFNLRPRNVYRSRRILASLHLDSHNCHYVQEIQVIENVDLAPIGSRRSNWDDFIESISHVLPQCNNLKGFRCVILRSPNAFESTEYASWNVPYPLPPRVFKTLATNPRLKDVHMLLNSSGSTEACDNMKKLAGCSKITDLQIVLEGKDSEMTPASSLSKPSEVNSLILVYLFNLKRTRNK